MILKKKIEDNFTSVHNAFLRDQNLSMTARGLLITMLSLNDAWNFSIKGLAGILKADGERRIASALKVNSGICSECNSKSRAVKS